MPLFRYRAVDTQGEVFEGTIDEQSAARVTAILQERGLQVSEVAPLALHKGLPFLHKPLTWEDIHLLNQQLLVIVKSDLPFVPALAAMATDINNPRLKPVLDGLKRDLELGTSIEQALQKHPDSFPPAYISMIRAGERSGNLAGVLALMENQSARVLDARHTLRTAMAYPAMVLVSAIGVIGFLCARVIPVWAEVFEDFGARLPAITRFWVDLSENLNRHGRSLFVVVIMLAVLLVGGLRLSRRSVVAREVIDRIFEHIPLVGRGVFLTALARFSRALALLLSSNVPVLESLDLAGAASGSALLRRHARRVARDVAMGESIADSFAATGYFPQLFCWLFATGEARGQVEGTLFDLSRSYEQQAAFHDRAIGQFISPLLVVSVALLVGWITVALYLPIFSLGDAISG